MQRQGRQEVRLTSHLGRWLARLTIVPKVTAVCCYYVWSVVIAGRSNEGVCSVVRLESHRPWFKSGPHHLWLCGFAAGWEMIRKATLDAEMKALC